MKAANPLLPDAEFRQSVLDMQRGATFAGGRVTLRANQTTTTVMYRYCSPRSNVLVTALSATSATAVGAGNIWVEADDKQFIVHHNSTADVDRAFSYLVLNTD